MSGIKLKVGKTYKSRKGEEVEIVDFCEGFPYPYKGSRGLWYSADGRWANRASPRDLIEEVPIKRCHAFTTPDDMKGVTSTRYTFAIPDGVTKLTVEQVSNRIVVEMVPEAKGPKPGDVLVNDRGSVYIFKSVRDDGGHNHFAWLGDSRSLRIAEWCFSGRPATPEEAQPLWDALKKAGKRWNGETLEVEEIPEIDLIREWVERHFLEGHYTQDNISEVIEAYSNYKEAKNNKKDV